MTMHRWPLANFQNFYSSNLECCKFKGGLQHSSFLFDTLNLGFTLHYYKKITMCKRIRPNVNGKEASKEKMNKIIQFWSSLYNSAPKLYIPFTRFDIGFSILSCCIICLIRLLNQYIFTNILEFNPNSLKTMESAACLTSSVHAMVLCSGLWPVLMSQPYVPSARIDSAPKEYQMAVSALLQLCTGYMLYDAIFMLKGNGWSIYPGDIAYFQHHLVTVLYMTQTRVIGYGHISAMGLMFTGELTNPLQNSHCITKYGIQLAQQGSLFHILHPYVEFAYGILYFIVRAIVGPIQIIHFAYHFLFTKTNVPLRVSIPWVVMSSGVIIGSIPWTVEAWQMLRNGLEVKYHENWDYGERYEL